MKLCIVCPDDQQLQHRLLAGALARRGYETSVAAGARWTGL